MIAPTISEVTSARSLKDFIEQGLQGTLGWSTLERLQIVVSKHGHTNHQSQVLDQLRGEYRGRIVPGFIPDRDQIRIATAILPGNDRRSYAQKYRRPMFNPVAVDIERVANRLYKRIFEASSDTEA